MPSVRTLSSRLRDRGGARSDAGVWKGRRARVSSRSAPEAWSWSSGRSSSPSWWSSSTWSTLVVVAAVVVVNPAAYADAAPERRRENAENDKPGPAPHRSSVPHSSGDSGKASLDPLGCALELGLRRQPAYDRAVDEAHAARADEHTPEAHASVNYGQALQGVSAIITPATLLTGIAFYFGWQRVRSFDEYFGLNPGAVGLSTRATTSSTVSALSSYRSSSC